MISRLVVDHIAYLTAISLLGNCLKAAVGYHLNNYCLILVKLRPDSFLNKIIIDVKTFKQK